MEVMVKKLDERAVIPKYAKPGDAGLDLVAITKELAGSTVGGHKYIYGTGLAFEIPPGYVGLIFPRSSIHKTGMVLTNCVGVIDSGYRGEVKFVFRNISHNKTYEIGDRIGQIMIVPYPQISLKEVDELSETDRGEGGFGSTGT